MASTPTKIKSNNINPIQTLNASRVFSQRKKKGRKS
jgi:hypothetical protein